MAPQLLSLVARDATPEEGALSQKKLTPTLIVGIVIAVLIVVGLAVWLGVRALRKRGATQREEERGAAFLNVRGLVNEGDQKRCVVRAAPLTACAHAPRAATASR